MSNPRTTIFPKPDQMPDSLPGRKNKNLKILEPDICLSDSELLIFMKRGDVEAFNILVERWRKKLYKITYRKVQDSVLTVTLIQEVFDDLWLQRAFIMIESLKLYLFTIVKYRVYQLHQHKKLSSSIEEPLNHFVMVKLQAESALSIEQIKKLIQDWLCTQPKEREEIFKLKYIAKFTSNEISQKLGISLNSVQHQIIVSRVSLNEFIHKHAGSLNK